MSFYERLIEWLNERRDLAFELVRIYLGLGLLAKGIYFIGHTSEVLQLMGEGGMIASNVMIAHYVALAHLVGGILLIVGLLTRLAALVQIPVLIGAVFLVHLREGFFGQSQNLEFSILVLFLLVLVALHGGGRLSADELLQKPAAEPAP